MIVEHEGWAECLKTCTRRDGVETTPFRRMIRKMPGTLHLQFTLYVHVHVKLHCTCLEVVKREGQVMKQHRNYMCIFMWAIIQSMCAAC